MVLVKKVVHILSILIYILIFIYLLICLPMIFGYKPLVVLTGSMKPTYEIGSILYYKKTNVEEINKGDVITFTSTDGTTITHRVNEILNDGLYETKGDANESVDPNHVSYTNILGKVTSLNIPLLGYGVWFVNNHIYLVLIIAIILILEFMYTNIKLPKLKKKEVEVRL